MVCTAPFHSDRSSPWQLRGTSLYIWATENPEQLRVPICAPLFFTGETLLPPHHNLWAGRHQAKPCTGGSLCTLHCAVKSFLWGRNTDCPLSVKRMCSPLLWRSTETPSFNWEVLFALCFWDQHSLNMVQFFYTGQDLPFGFFFPLAAKYPEYGIAYLHGLYSSWCW